jgi:hypothetical protein
MDIDKNARQTPKGRERASRSAKRWRLPALSSRLLAAYGSRRGRAARTGRFLQRCHSAVGGVRRGELAGGGSSVQGRTASEGPPVAAGLFQVLALKCLSVYHLTIWPFNFMNSAPFGGALNGPPGE